MWPGSSVPHDMWWQQIKALGLHDPRSGFSQRTSPNPDHSAYCIAGSTNAVMDGGTPDYARAFNGATRMSSPSWNGILTTANCRPAEPTCDSARTHMNWESVEPTSSAVRMNAHWHVEEIDPAVLVGCVDWYQYPEKTPRTERYP